MEMASNVCVSDAQMHLGGTSFETMLSRYVFPPVFLVGYLGNAINLCVLLSPTMRNRANYLLSAMAFADMTFLLFMLPHSLANYPTFALNYSFRWLYFHCKSEIYAMANWSSAAAIWFVLAVCIDRLYGIKSPLYSCKEWSSRKMGLVLIGICVATAILTSYYHFAYDCIQINSCNGTQIHSACMSVASDTWFKNRTNPHPYWKRSYIRIGTIANALLVIIIPVFALVALNIALVHALKQRSKEPLLKPADGVRRASDGAVQRKQERKVAVTVCAIVGCFTLTQGPSAIMMVWNMATDFATAKNQTLYDLNSAANFLVTVGKASNFFLFCLSSSNFRQRLFHVIKRRSEYFSSHNNSPPHMVKNVSTTSTTLIKSPRCSIELMPQKQMRTRASSYCTADYKQRVNASMIMSKYRSLDSTDM